MVMKFVWAFIVGGALCVIAQILLDKTNLTPARILVSYVVVGVLLGAVGLYAPLAELAGGGATTPLTGFGYLISKGVRQAVDEKGLLGALTGGGVDGLLIHKASSDHDRVVEFTFGLIILHFPGK